MMDKQYCMSSYLSFRFIEDDSKDFTDNIRHAIDTLEVESRIPVKNADDIASAYKKIIDSKEDIKLGILLSGGMDSACVAANLKPGTDAYTFRFLDGQFADDDLIRAQKYSDKYNLNLHYVDINREVVKKNLPVLMKRKGAPVHSIEPQIMEAAIQAKNDGVEMIVIADSSDMTFGGLDRMLSKDWSYEEWIDFYTFCKPEDILTEPRDMSYLYKEYRLANNKIDYLRFMDEVFSRESLGSYYNACVCADMKYKPFLDPSAMVVMSEPFDLDRIRSGESKYLIRELFHMYYPEFEIPEKIPMPRPVDYYFKDWNGPSRPEFRTDIDLKKLSGNQKWQVWCLEEYLNMIDGK